jgi:hypothetical protein
MASGKRPPSGGQSGRRRRPPTIDLRATEVPSRPEPAEPQVEPPAVPPQSEPAQPRVEDAFIPPPPVRPVHAFEPPPPHEQAAFEPPPEPPRAPRHDEPLRKPSSGRGTFAFLPEELSWSHAGAGMAGAAGGLLVVLLLWLVGAFSGGRAPATDLGPRLAAIETQLRELSAFAARPAPPGVDPKLVEDMAGRLARLEGAQAQPRAPATDPVVLGRLSATENAVKSLADNVAGLSRRGDGFESALVRRSDGIEAVLRDAQARLDKLAAALTDLQTTARAAAVGSDRAVRLAVAAATLRAAVERGDPFAAELAVAKPLTANPGALGPLEPFAATGVPGGAALARELTALLQPMLRAAGEPPRDGSFLDRLQANAEKLVRIRPIDESRGDDRAAILGRVERRAAQANIEGALAELARLPPAARAPLQAWIAKVEARNKAIEASRRFAADAIAALKAVP